MNNSTSLTEYLSRKKRVKAKPSKQDPIKIDWDAFCNQFGPELKAANDRLECSRALAEVWACAQDFKIQLQVMTDLETEIVREVKREWGQEAQISFDKDQCLILVVHPQRGHGVPYILCDWSSKH